MARPAEQIAQLPDTEYESHQAHCKRWLDELERTSPMDLLEVLWQSVEQVDESKFYAADLKVQLKEYYKNDKCPTDNVMLVLGEAALKAITDIFENE